MTNQNSVLIFTAAIAMAEGCVSRLNATFPEAVMKLAILVFVQALGHNVAFDKVLQKTQAT